MRDKMTKTKTKRVDGIDLSPSCFAYVGDPEDTNRWKFCLHVPGDVQKTINQIKNGLSRFDVAKGLPDSERTATWYALFGAARSHGIPVERREFIKPTVEAPKAELMTAELNDADLAAAIAEADRKSDAMLRMLGY
jgi:hypothetical protein